MPQCKSIGCDNEVTQPGTDFCNQCNYIHSILELGSAGSVEDEDEYTEVELDTYDVHQAFNIQDPSGCLQRASRIILMSGMMNPESDLPQANDIMIARDMLTRWLELNEYA